MMKIIYETNQVVLYHGDACEVLRQMNDQRVDAIITSFPAVSGPYLSSVVTELRRVLRPQGTMWLNSGEVHGRVEEKLKPVYLGSAMQVMVSIGSPDGGVILDPFMGNGSTAVFALRNGRQFVGIDSDEKVIRDIVIPKVDSYLKARKEVLQEA